MRRVAAIGLLVGVTIVVGVILFPLASSDPSSPPEAATTAAPADFDPVREGEPTPEGFRQVLARDQIEPIYGPEFTDAGSVDWPEDMLVLGVAGATEAKAYPITHLNRHEMVNDVLEGEPILATW